MFCVSCPNFLKANSVVAYGCLSMGIVSSRLLIPLAGDRMSIRGWGRGARGSGIGMIQCPRGEPSVQSPVYRTGSGGCIPLDLPGWGQGE